MGKVAKKGTQSSRRHAFVSFRNKVDSIKIDPVRKLHKRPTDSSDQTSYFTTALNHWNELNITPRFSLFYEECLPLCQSLPQLLFNQQQVVDLLEASIKVQDVNTLEASLDLLTHFAHDLGSDFEPYFQRFLLLIIDLVVSQSTGDSSNNSESLQVVEWAFNCLAYLFKYLCRLLTVDLRPTYDCMADLLGRTHKRRPFIARYSAEALSFLLRRSTGDSLISIVDHILIDLTTVDQSRQNDFVSSIVTLFAESMKSTGQTLHSRASNIYSVLLSSTFAQKNKQLYSQLVSDITINLLHHARQDTATEIYARLYELLDDNFSSDSVSSEDDLYYFSKLLFTVAGLRKGSRVPSWIPLFERSINLLSRITTIESSPLIISVVDLCEVLLTSPDPQAIAMYHSRILDLVYKIDLSDQSGDRIPLFLIICSLLAENSERFGLAAPFLIRYANSDKSDIKATAYTLIRLKNTTDFQLQQSSTFATHLFSNIRKFNALNSPSDAELFDLWWTLDVVKASIPLDESCLPIFDDLLNSLLKSATTSENLYNSLIGKTLILRSSINSSLSNSVLAQVLVFANDFKSSADFMQGFLHVLRYVFIYPPAF